MKGFLFLFVVSINLYKNVHSRITCNNLGTHYYDERGCTPNYEKGCLCPSYYTCKTPLAKNGVCTIWNKFLKDGEELSNGCENYLCTVKDQKKPGALETFTTYCFVYWPMTPNCTGIYSSLNSCCGSGENCETESKVCFKDGKYHNPNEIFMRKNKCERCICAKDLTGDSYKVLCEPLLCNSKSWQPEKIAENCAPVYSKNGIPCCPQSYICEEDIVDVSGETVDEHDEGKICTFGGSAYAKGTEFTVTTTSEDVSCKCEVPPNPICRI